MHMCVILGLGFTGRAATSSACALAATTAISTASATTPSAREVLVVVLGALALPVTLALLRQTSLLCLLGLEWLLLLRLLSQRSGLLAPLEVGDGSRNRLRVLVNVEGLVDAGGDGLNLSTQIPFNVVEVETVVPVNQVNSQTQVAVTAGSTNAVQIRLCILGEIKVDDDINRLDINTSGEQVGANKVSADTVSEIVENTVSSMLLHLCVTVEARVT